MVSADDGLDIDDDAVVSAVIVVRCLKIFCDCIENIAVEINNAIVRDENKTIDFCCCLSGSISK